MTITKRRKTKSKPSTISQSYTPPALCRCDPSYDAHIEYWALLSLVQLGLYKQVFDDSSVSRLGDKLLPSIGLNAIVENQYDGHDYSLAMALLKERYHEICDQGFPELPANSALETNLGLVQDTLGLNTNEVAVLRFRILLESSPALKTTLDDFEDELLASEAIHILSVLLGLSQEEVRNTLISSNLLIKSGLLEFNQGSNDFSSKLCLIPCIAENIFEQNTDVFDLFSEQLAVSSAPKLTTANFQNLSDQTYLLTKYLSQVELKQGRNFLLYGPPGSGKTEYVKAIANSLGFKLYEIPSITTHVEPYQRSPSRLQNYRLAQQIVSRSSKAMILFDEVEDVFGRGSDFLEQLGLEKNEPSSRMSKLGINQLLENNPVPAFWVANDIRGIDNAYLRRFDSVIRLDAPARNVRTQIIQNYFEDIPVSQRWMMQIAAYDKLVPAVIERTAKVVSCLKDESVADIERLATSLMAGTLEAMDMPPLPKSKKVESLAFKLKYLNTNPSLEEVAIKLIAVQEARICLYGPPGTGKTAFGRHLAEALNKPLLVKRASDILGSYVGESERAIAQMFNEAEKTGSVLLLDEADSFLQSRSKAGRSWEITLVNEMLTQMESFEGVFVASTNFMTELDEATLRRFDIKAKFDWLKPWQVTELFEQCAELIRIPVDEAALTIAKSLSNLTPGDFANVLRQSRLRKVGSSLELAEALGQEAKLKRKDSGRRIGFN